MAWRTTKRFYSVDPGHISVIQFILEAYDNVAVVSTVDAWRAVIAVAIAPGCETLVESVMADLTRSMPIHRASGRCRTAAPCPDQRRNDR